MMPKSGNAQQIPQPTPTGHPFQVPSTNSGTLTLDDLDIFFAPPIPPKPRACTCASYNDNHWADCELKTS